MSSSPTIAAVTRYCGAHRKLRIIKSYLHPFQPPESNVPPLHWNRKDVQPLRELVLVLDEQPLCTLVPVLALLEQALTSLLPLQP